MSIDGLPDLLEQLKQQKAANKILAEEIEIKNRTIQLLLIAGHLEKERLEQATELASGS